MLEDDHHDVFYRITTSLSILYYAKGGRGACCTWRKVKKGQGYIFRRNLDFTGGGVYGPALRKGWGMGEGGGAGGLKREEIASTRLNALKAQFLEGWY